jgi:uncharacterized protein YjbI with pentapeptide repeats
MFTIKSKYFDEVIYISETANTTREAVMEAIKNKISLENANLIGVDLSGLDLRGSNFRGANLKGANLINTDFSNSDLLGVYFVEAN